MSYVGIGNRQDYIADFPTQSFNGDGSTTTFTLNFEAVTGSVRVAVDNVLQPADGTAYYTNGNSITFTSAPATGTANITVTYLGTVRNVNTVSDNSISSSKIQYPLTGFESTGIDDNATSNALTLDSSANLQFNSGYGSVATAYGCRAWVNFNGTGTVAIRDSGNVTSITDNDTGVYTVNFSTSMPDVNYAISGGVLESVANKYFRGVSIQSISTSSFQIASYRPTDGVATDVEVFTLMVAR